ncbi:hypothetical protein MTES_2010 [Microbacterium testaceum StLB037]|uniref:Uncharacterized protein n=1 Tax=Microbacterium testaceum (strain StLB037) TaxID=979556 RepID=E8NDB6_MICTS|nr:hypothetical protein [Microbacterium testaceum]BAJ74974.1 hypothetical protein MTES_2010 [Microbacterium testaceum StLB037]
MTWAEPGAAWTDGRWSLERRGDELADLAVDGVVVLRSVRLVLRDRDWGTVDFDVERCESGPAAVTLHVRGGGIVGTVGVRVDGARLEVVADVVAEREVETNRLGLVVLHPPAVAGADLTVTHTEGAVEATRFPRAISPHQPALDIAALAWEHRGLALSMTLEGDVFEMEDQRNWTDASFKTYSRPLELPFPYRLAAGSRVRQAVTLRATGAAEPLATADDEVVLRPAGVVPALGVGAATAPDPAPPPAPVGSFVRVELDLASPAWRAALDRATASGLPLDVRFVRASPRHLRAAVAPLRGLDVRTVGAFAGDGPEKHVSDATTVAGLREALHAEGLDLPVVGGARTHFTELNRGHSLLPDDLDGVGFALTPLFHARATAQLVESLGILPLIARQAVKLSGGTPVHVGPVTLRPHVDAVATTAEPVPSEPDLRAGYGPALLDAADPRQSAPELAAWTVASLAALTTPGIASVAFFEEWGPRGIRSSSGEPYPVAEALDVLASLAGSSVEVGCSADSRVWVMRVTTAEGRVTLAANLDERARDVRVGAGRMRLPAGAWLRAE